MLQIKKIGHSMNIKYKFKLLFRLANLKKKYLLKKKISKSVILRSPKHFNIGKQKIVSVNYLFLNVSLNLKGCISTKFLSHQTSHLFKVLDKFTETNMHLKTESIKISIKTKFKITWLEF